VDHPDPALDVREPSIRRVPSRWMPRLKEGGIVGRSWEKGNARLTQMGAGRSAQQPLDPARIRVPELDPTPRFPLPHPEGDKIREG
jgi:hypothetical protein